MLTRAQSEEVLVGVADAGLRVSTSGGRLEALLRATGPIAGRSLLDLLEDEPRSRLQLVARRVTREVVLTSAADGTSELVARAALVGEETWVLLCERGRSVARGRDTLGPHDAFVGRAAEIAEFERYLGAADSSVMYVHGAAGTGKSELVAALAARCDELGCRRFVVDARTLPPTQEALLHVILPTARAGLAGCFQEIRDLAGVRWALFVDNFDAWQDVTHETSERPCAPLPVDCRLVVVARRPPDRRWWELARRTPRALELGPLTPSETGELLARLGVPPERRDEVAGRSAGHPLCVVSLASAVRRGAPDSVASAAVALDFQLAEIAPAEHLEAAAVPARITEEALGCLLGGEAAAAAFDAMKLVAFRDPSGVGLRLPPALRDALRARLRERSPARLEAMQRRVAAEFATIVESAQGYPAAATAALADLLESLDDVPFVRAIVGTAADYARVRPAEPSEASALEQAARTLGAEGAAAQIGARFREGLARTWVVEDGGVVEGIMQLVRLDATSLGELAERRDDVELGAAIAALRKRTALGSGEQALACVAWVTRAGPEPWGDAHRALFRLLLTELVVSRGLVAWLFVQPDPPVTLPVGYLPGATVVRGGPRIVVHRSFAEVSLGQLLAALFGGRAHTPARLSSVDVELASSAVREALASMGQPERLATSPLLALSLVQREGGGTPLARAGVLVRILREIMDELGRDPRQGRDRHVLEAVFLGGGGKHEKIAADLGLPYSTFRRHLTRAIERATAALRAREVAAREERCAKSGEHQVSTDQGSWSLADSE